MSTTPGTATSSCTSKPPRRFASRLAWRCTLSQRSRPVRKGSLLNRLIAAAGRAAEILLPEPRVAVAMSELTALAEVPDLSWPDVARLRIHELTAAGDGRMEVTALGTEALVVEVRKGALVEERVDLVPGAVDTIAWDKGSTTLVLVTASGRRLELALKELA
jgi:hypothetical protein